MTSNTIIHQRNRYINKIKPFIGKRLIKVFVGQRRVGKSYLLFQLMDIIKTQNKEATICYINKEDLSFDFIKTGKDLSDYVISQKKR
jgi:predicted AAA+ superfamily ATPase